MLRFFFITWSTFLTGYLNMTHRYSPTCTNGNLYRVKFPSDCISLCNKPDDISITVSCGVILRERYERNWPSDVHTWPHKCKRMTELYLLGPPKGLLKNVGSLCMSSIDFTKTTKGRKQTGERLVFSNNHDKSDIILNSAKLLHSRLLPLRNKNGQWCQG